MSAVNPAAAAEDDTALVLTMKWGRRYGPECVNRLYRGVKRNLRRKLRFVCFTDDGTGIDANVEVLPLPKFSLADGNLDSRWRKLSLFAAELPGGLTGTALFLDLDQIVVGDMEPFFTLPGEFRILRDMDLFRAKPLRLLAPKKRNFLNRVGNSSVFRFEIGQHAYVLDAYLESPAEATKRFKISQQFQSAQLASHNHLDYWPRGWCVSFKNDCVPRHAASFFKDPVLPKGARIVCFAGEPKMNEALYGSGSRWYRRIGDVEWLRQAWEGEDMTDRG